jgi:hypothetical protein
MQQFLQRMLEGGVPRDAELVAQHASGREPAVRGEPAGQDHPSERLVDLLVEGAFAV